MDNDDSELTRNSHVAPTFIGSFAYLCLSNINDNYLISLLYLVIIQAQATAEEVVVMEMYSERKCVKALGVPFLL